MSQCVCPCGLTQDNLLELLKADKSTITKGKCQIERLDKQGICGELLGAHEKGISIICYVNF
jgi:hypothetical protein